MQYFYCFQAQTTSVRVAESTWYHYFKNTKQQPITENFCTNLGQMLALTQTLLTFYISTLFKFRSFIHIYCTISTVTAHRIKLT